MTIIRLENLCRQGEPDVGECSIIVEKEKYNELPILPRKSFADYIIEEGYFSEVYRTVSGKPRAEHKAIRLYNPKNKDEVDENNQDLIDNQTYWYFIWVEEEEVWIVFKYRNLNTLSESYNATVETSFPWHGTVYRPNEDVEKIIKKVLNN